MLIKFYIVYPDDDSPYIDICNEEGKSISSSAFHSWLTDDYSYQKVDVLISDGIFFEEWDEEDYMFIEEKDCTTAQQAQNHANYILNNYKNKHPELFI